MLSTWAEADSAFATTVQPSLAELPSDAASPPNNAKLLERATSDGSQELIKSSGSNFTFLRQRAVPGCQNKSLPSVREVLFPASHEETIQTATPNIRIPFGAGQSSVA